MEKNAKNETFSYKELKRTQESCILLKRMFAQPWFLSQVDRVGNSLVGSLSKLLILCEQKSNSKLVTEKRGTEEIHS